MINYCIAFDYHIIAHDFPTCCHLKTGKPSESIFGLPSKCHHISSYLKWWPTWQASFVGPWSSSRASRVRSILRLIWNRACLASKAIILCCSFCDKIRKLWIWELQNDIKWPNSCFKELLHRPVSDNVIVAKNAKIKNAIPGTRVLRSAQGKAVRRPCALHMDWGCCDMDSGVCTSLGKTVGLGFGSPGAWVFCSVCVHGHGSCVCLQECHGLSAFPFGALTGTQFLRTQHVATQGPTFWYLLIFVVKDWGGGRPWKSLEGLWIFGETKREVGAKIGKHNQIRFKKVDALNLRALRCETQIFLQDYPGQSPCPNILQFACRWAQIHTNFTSAMANRTRLRDVSQFAVIFWGGSIQNATVRFWVALWAAKP